MSGPLFQLFVEWLLKPELYFIALQFSIAQSSASFFAHQFSYDFYIIDFIYSSSWCLQVGLIIVQEERKIKKEKKQKYGTLGHCNKRSERKR